MTTDEREWDVLKAHARAQCKTAADRMWCEAALALGEVARALARTSGEYRGVRERLDRLHAERKAATAAEMQRRAVERAERKAVKAAKREAREGRKRLRRLAAQYEDPTPDGVYWARVSLAGARSRLRDARRRVPRWESGIHYARLDVREAELRYAIACAVAGAVPS